MAFEQWLQIVAATACWVFVASVWFFGAFLAFRRRPLAGSTLVGLGFLLIGAEQLLETAGYAAISSAVRQGRIPESDYMLYYQTLSYLLIVLKFACGLLLVSGVTRIWRLADQQLPAAPIMRDVY